MRKASSDYAIITNEDNEFMGIALGYDYCAEHEWGIDDMKNRFAIPEGGKKNMGVKSRSITKNIPNLIFKKETYKKKKFAILYTGHQYWHEGDDNLIPHDLEHYKKDIDWRIEYDSKNPSEHRETKDPMISAWDGGSFGVGVMGEKEVKCLEELYLAFQNKNVVIAMINHRAHNPFAGTSLSLMIKDRLPQEITDMMYNADKEYQDRVDYEKKIGMTKLKQSTREGSHDNKYGHKHGYYIACSANWIDYDDKENRKAKKEKHHTKYDILYWVNYSDDDDTHDHFTVEEVREWLKGTKKLSAIRARNDAKKEKSGV